MFLHPRASITPDSTTTFSPLTSPTFSCLPSHHLTSAHPFLPNPSSPFFFLPRLTTPPVSNLRLTTTVLPSPSPPLASPLLGSPPCCHTIFFCFASILHTSPHHHDYSPPGRPPHFSPLVSNSPHPTQLFPSHVYLPPRYPHLIPSFLLF